MKNKYLLSSLLGLLPLLLHQSCSKTALLPEQALLICQATLVPIEEDSKEQIADILILADTIAEIGQLKDRKELQDVARIDAQGLYLMPGLTDGFAALNNQNYARAYLEMGITSIIAVDGGRRGPFFQARPSPTVFRLEGIGLEKTSDKDMLRQIDSLYQAGYRVLLLMYKLTPDQIQLALQRARQLGMATLGELGYTTYAQGMQMGIDAFVHTTRYSLDIAPRSMAAAVAEEPFSNDLQSPKWKYYDFLSQIQTGDSALLAHARRLGSSDSYIMPTSSLSYLDLPEHSNPWKETVAQYLSAEDINRPADKKTGQHQIDSAEQAAYTRLILNELQTLEPTYHRHGAHYLTGSGTDVWGTMPGISLHTELQLMHRYIGLSKREVLAASTLNFSKAFGWKIGRIQKGYKANLILLKGNPLIRLEELKKPEIVILEGRQL